MLFTRESSIMNRLAILVCLILLANLHSALALQESKQTKPSQTQPPRRSMRELVMMPVVYRVPGMDEVLVKTDLKYTDASDPNLLMDVYTPRGLAKSERRPAVLFIHGGAGSAFKPKDWAYTSRGDD